MRVQVLDGIELDYCRCIFSMNDMFEQGILEYSKKKAQNVDHTNYFKESQPGTQQHSVLRFKNSIGLLDKFSPPKIQKGR